MKQTTLVFVILAVILEAILGVLKVAELITNQQFKDYSTRSLIILAIMLGAGLLIKLITKQKQN